MTPTSEPGLSHESQTLSFGGQDYGRRLSCMALLQAPTSISAGPTWISFWCNLSQDVHHHHHHLHQICILSFSHETKNHTSATAFCPLPGQQNVLTIALWLKNVMSHHDLKS